MLKKIKYIILLFIIILCFNIDSYGMSVSLNKSNVSLIQGNSTSVTITANDATGNISVSSSNSNVATASLSTDWLENSSATINIRAVGIGTATITISGKVANDAGTNQTNVNKTINVTVTNASSSSGNSSSTGGSTSNGNSGSSGSSTPSSGAELAMITTSPVDFKGFKSASSGPYYVTVENSVTKIGVSAKGKNGSTYTVSGNTELQVGTNKVTVTAKKANNTKEYYIYVTRKASNDEKITPNQIDKDEDEKEEEDKKLRLTNIILDDSLNIKLDPNFDPEIFEYTVVFGEDYLDLEEILINAIANIEDAKVTIKGNENLVDGENIVIITVEAKGYETVIYTIKVMKQKVEETIAMPVLEINNDELDNSDEILKKKIAICLLTSLIALIGIIFIAKQCYESTNDQKDNLKDDYEDIPSNQIIHNNYDNNKKDIQEDNILQDIYTKNHFKDSQEEKPLQEEKLQRQERTNKETDEKTDKVILDEFFNTKMNFYEGKPSRRRGKGKHS